jgi:predicted transcriptional regulator
MRKSNVPETSKEAYKSLDPARLRESYKKILLALSELGSGTFEDISKKMKVDKSVVWKRLSELHQMELIYRPGEKKLLKSGRNGYVWSLTTKGMPKTENEMKALKGKPTVADHSRQIQSISEQAKQMKLL